jgi:hypothetical protein
MRRIVFGVIGVLSMNCALASEAGCAVLAEKQRVAENAKQQFIQACLDRITQGSGSEMTAQKSSTNETPQALCADMERCDPSTQLEASAAGLGNGTRANSGHNFVRVKRVSE